ncbi:unnamed protein product, partial [Gulo gulo]
MASCAGQIRRRTEVGRAELASWEMRSEEACPLGLAEGQWRPREPHFAWSEM